MSAPVPQCHKADAGEAGYALVAAVVAILFFATISLGVLSITQRSLLGGRAEIESARAAAVADAGIAIAIRGLLANGPDNAFPIDGTPRRFTFDGASLTVSVRDERGKVPINLLEETQLTLLLESAGLAGSALDVARDSLLDWIDDDDDERPNGAERLFYRDAAIAPRNGNILTLGELGRIRGFSPGIVQKIAAVATTDFGSGSFDLRTATPAAIAIMYPNGDAAVDEILRAREVRQQVTALDFGDRSSRIGRPLTIDVKASYPSGVRGAASCVVELTGAVRRPYVVRHCA